MFVAFWFSFVSLVLLAAAVVCVSTDADSITNVPFFTGVITVDMANGSTSDFNIYAGLNRVVIRDCDLGTQCPPDSISWNSVNCDQYFTNCGACADASLGSVTTVIIALVTQIPQCTGTLGRSMGKSRYCKISLRQRSCSNHTLFFFFLYNIKQPSSIFIARKRKFILLITIKFHLVIYILFSNIEWASLRELLDF